MLNVSGTLGTVQILSQLLLSRHGLFPVHSCYQSRLSLHLLGTSGQCSLSVGLYKCSDIKLMDICAHMHVHTHDTHAHARAHTHTHTHTYTDSYTFRNELDEFTPLMFFSYLLLIHST